MGVYGFRNNKFKSDSLEAYKELNVLKYPAPKAVAYIKLQACVVGTPTSKNRFAYVFLGTAGRLCISSTAPVGTTGAFANKGSPLGTAA
jgi:hypothetical protein